MSVEEFMLKPIIDKLLEKKDFETLAYTIHNNMFNGNENKIKITNPKTVQIGQSCKLYFECKHCKETKLYQQFSNKIDNLRKGKRMCKNCRRRINEETLNHKEIKR